MLVMTVITTQPICPICLTIVENHDAVQCDGCKSVFHDQCLKDIGDRKLCVFCRQDEGLNE